LIIVETDPGVGQCASQFRGSVNRLPLAASLSPPHFASSFDDPGMLKFSHSFLYFIDHDDLPFSLVCWQFVECLLKAPLWQGATGRFRSMGGCERADQQTSGRI
jgi:hypothetical protein